MDENPKKTEEEKPDSWAPLLHRQPTEEELEQMEFEAQRTARLDSAILKIPIVLEEMHKTLQEMLLVWKSMVEYEGDTEELESGIEPEPAPESPPQAAPIPENLEKDEKIEKFYLGQLSDILSESILAKTEVSVAEDRVILKLPYLGDTSLFAKVARKLRELGGQYQSMGKDSHFILPKK